MPSRQAQHLVRGGGQVLRFAHTRRGTTAAMDLSLICVDERDVLGSYSVDITLQKQVARLVFSKRLAVDPSFGTGFHWRKPQTQCDWQQTGTKLP